MPDLDNIHARYQAALAKRAPYEAEWEECYAYALPHKLSSDKRAEALYDSTAENGVANLASSLLSQLTPPWSKWFGLTLGVDGAAAPSELEKYERILQSHFDRSNFYVEAHQAYLDLATLGTAVLLFEEAPVGEASAFNFRAVPMAEIALEEQNGKIESIFRRSYMSPCELAARFGTRLTARAEAASPDERIALVEAVTPRITSTGAQGYNYVAFAEDAEHLLSPAARTVVKSGVFAHSPFIAFRWLKTPGETYGRSPVMKAMADIKTANKVVELVLKNASIAVAGVWQADDDGVINLDNLVLAPGTIIPKAVGEALLF